MSGYEFTKKDRLLVQFAKTAGVTHARIAEMLNISRSTLEKHFRDVLDRGADELNAQVVGSLFKNAASGNVSAQIFWCKARLGWKEKSEVAHVGDITPVIRIGGQPNEKKTEEADSDNLPDVVN